MKNLNLHLGDYKDHHLFVYGGGFEKVNLITGMKGGGKSHITKGIIAESLKAGMSAVVFDINNEYDKLPNALLLKVGINLKFRLDFIKTETFFGILEKLAPLSEKTAYAVYAKIPQIIEQCKTEWVTRKNKDIKSIPDLDFLKKAVNKIIEGKETEATKSMKVAYIRSLENLDNHKLIMTQNEAWNEDEAIKSSHQPPDIISLRTAFNNMFLGDPQVLIFQIGGLPSSLQKVIVKLVIDHLKESCDKQTKFMNSNNANKYPIYPTIYFEEAHMYMDTRDIDDLVPLIRHIGINVFFVTNTPGALPESVFRLLDNLIMTRMVNRKDIDRVADCGLTDKETIVGFAQNLKDHHALFLSAKDGATRNFPLVFHVRDFGLPKSGATRSQWEAMKELPQSNSEELLDG
jgi:hypothetical protein